MPKNIHSYLKAVYREITTERIYDWTSPKESSRGVLRRLDYAFGFKKDAEHPDIDPLDENPNGLLRILEKYDINDRDVKYVIQTAQERCDELKKLLYKFMVADYKKFHEDATSLFSTTFSDINDLSHGIAYELPQRSIFYRMRKVQQEDAPERIHFFHVPFTRRYLMGTYRYSIPGYPSLYTSSSLYCCWEEMERPNLKECGCAALRTVKPMQLLDLRWKINNEEFLEDKNIEQLKNYILKLPIIIACSLQVQSTPDKFVPEYVISQQVFQWLMSELRNDKTSKSRMTLGIVYTSAKKEVWESIKLSELKDLNNITNYALLAYLPQEENTKTYSKYLAKWLNAKSPLWFTERFSPYESIYQTLEKKQNLLIKPKRSRWRSMATHVKK